MNFFTKLLGKSPKHSSEAFNAVYQNLLSIVPVSQKNKDQVVENIRIITEEIIWSEQNQGDFFEYAIQHNLFRFFLNLLNETKMKEVQIQLIQTATMLIHNLSSQEYKRKKQAEYLLKTMFYREIIGFSFDFSDEEIVEIYMSMLKAFAINLKPEMFSEFVAGTNFTLLTGAMTFMNYHESMIKTASRTVILSVFTLRSKNIKNYVLNSGFFPMFVSSISEKLTMCDRLILSNNISRLDMVLSEVSEDLYYVNDILGLNIKEFTQILGNMLIKSLIFPVAISSLGSITRCHFHISIPLAGNFLHHLLRIVKNQLVVNATVLGIIGKVIPNELLDLLQESTSPSIRNDDQYLELVSKYLEYLEGFSCNLTLVSNTVPEVIFSFLTSKDNNLTGTTLILLYTIMTCSTVSNNLLLSAGLIPYERLKIKKLIHKLVSNTELNGLTSSSAIEPLLDLLRHEHPLQIFLFKLVCKVLVSLSFRSDSAMCLSQSQLKILNKAFNRSIEKLQDFLIENSDYDNFLFVFEAEWRNLDLNELKILNHAQLLMPYNEELANVPLEYREPLDETESLKCEIQRLFAIWQVKFALAGDPSLLSLKVYPLFYLADAKVVEKDKSYHMRNRNLVECLIKLKKVEENFLYASDPDFILFVKPDSKYEDFYIVKFYHSLIDIEAIQDRSDPRRLVLMVNTLEETYEIIFNDTKQCTQTLKDINNAKAKCRSRYVELLNKLFQELTVGIN